MIASIEPYTPAMRQWIDVRGKHYLANAPPQAYFMVAVRMPAPGLFDEIGGGLHGVVAVGRPIARNLPQDGSWCEVTRLVLIDCPPHTASWALQCAMLVAAQRGHETMISYHDRTRHTGCIYRKAGFRKDIACKITARGWATKGDGRASSAYPQTPKRRWIYDLRPLTASLRSVMVPHAKQTG